MTIVFVSLRLPVSTTETEHVTLLGNPVLSRLYTDDTVLRQFVAMVKYLKLHGFGCICTRCLYRFLIQHMHGILVKIWDTISVFIMHSLQTIQVDKFAQFNAELYASVNGPLNSGSSFVTMSFLDYNSGPLLEIHICLPQWYSILIFQYSFIFIQSYFLIS